MIAISFLRVCMMGTIVGVGLTGCSQPSNSNNKAVNNSPKSDSTATVTTNSATTIATKAPKNRHYCHRWTPLARYYPSRGDRWIGAEGYKQGENLTIDFQSAQGNPATAGQIAKQFVGENPDAIVAISTPSAQTIVANTTTIPVIYTAVSDPVAAKLTDSNNKPTQANITGLSSQLPLAPQFDFIQQIMPNAKSIGYVFSSGEANSVSLGNRLKAELPKRGLTLWISLRFVLPMLHPRLKPCKARLRWFILRWITTWLPHLSLWYWQQIPWKCRLLPQMSLAYGEEQLRLFGCEWLWFWTCHG